MVMCIWLLKKHKFHMEKRKWWLCVRVCVCAFIPIQHDSTRTTKKPILKYYPKNFHTWKIWCIRFPSFLWNSISDSNKLYNMKRIVDFWNGEKIAWNQNDAIESVAAKVFRCWNFDFTHRLQHIHLNLKHHSLNAHRHIECSKNLIFYWIFYKILFLFSLQMSTILQCSFLRILNKIRSLINNYLAL